jgi:hypothetical protein
MNIPRISATTERQADAYNQVLQKGKYMTPKYHPIGTNANQHQRPPMTINE